MVVEHSVSFEEACAGSLVGEVLTVSHRWMKAHEPDPDGTQLRVIKEYLKAHPRIKLVWYDAWCLPQGDRTPGESRVPPPPVLLIVLHLAPVGA